MAFKVFSEYGAAARDEATLRKSGYLFLSKGILHRFGATSAKGAILLFDEDEKKIGVRFVDEPDKEESARPISKEKAGVAVNLLPVLRYYGYGKPADKQIMKIQAQDDLLVVDLAQYKAAPDQEEEEGEYSELV